MTLRPTVSRGLPCSDLAVGNLSGLVDARQAKNLKLFLNVAIKSGFKETLINPLAINISYC
jgi:hypothetical protein